MQLVNKNIKIDFPDLASRETNGAGNSKPCNQLNVVITVCVLLINSKNSCLGRKIKITNQLKQMVIINKKKFLKSNLKIKQKININKNKFIYKPISKYQKKLKHENNPNIGV